MNWKQRYSHEIHEESDMQELHPDEMIKESE